MPRLQSRKRRADDDQTSPTISPAPEPQRQRRADEDEEDDDDEDAYGNESMTQGDGVQDMAKKLVRLALTCEYQRKPIRRLEIGEKVLGPNGRQFKRVFDEAQIHLRTVFGMEMVQLPVKEKVTLQQKRAAQKAASQKAPVTSWILSSTLPYEFRRPDIIRPPAAPTKSADATYTATYTLLVTLIALSGGTLPDAKMERYLRRMQMEDRTPVEGYQKTELLLKRMEKDGYIMKIRESTGTGEDDVYWLVGPRGKVEIGRNGVTGLTKAVYGDQADEEAEDELDRRIARSLALDESTPAEQTETQQAEKATRHPKQRSNAREDAQNEDEDDEDEDEDD